MLLAALVLSFGSFQDIAPQPVPTPVTKRIKPRKICRDDRTTGSRLASSTCLTAEEWAARDAAARDSMDDLRQRASSVSEAH